ncbi:Aste57867_8778 [Aphanomyces stellatus]|uniref:Aste57867_8778 protein n=1 Tax=Aphanomyces stellatus TaxID=120398 RepID=A0A485KL55_9STRA|nr:hypothetical protein As57867_008744 [Aphanomyces stellatus]VFT85664.1 Aste57867_8778 [Aphanomyces stellatus]
MRFPYDLRAAKQFLSNDEHFCESFKRQCQTLLMATEKCVHKKASRLKRSLHYLSLVHHAQNEVERGVRDSLDALMVRYTALMAELACAFNITQWTDMDLRLEKARAESLHIGIQLDQMNQLVRKEIKHRHCSDWMTVTIPAGFLPVFAYLSPEETASCLTVSRTWRTTLQCHCILSQSFRQASQRWCYWQSLAPVLDPLPSLTTTPATTAFDHVIELEVERTTFFPKETMYPRRRCDEKRPPLDHDRLGLHSSKSLTLHDLHAKLRGLLTSYAARHPAVGYGHGMTFLGAVLLSSLDYDADASLRVFSALLHTMRSLWHGCPTSFGPGLQARLDVLGQCITLYAPPLARRLGRHAITPNMFASSWVLSLFLNDHALPPHVCMHIVDTFLADGWLAMYALYVGLLVVHLPALVPDDDDNDPTDLLQMLLALPKHLAAGLAPYRVCALTTLSPPLASILEPSEIEREPHP